MSIFLSLLLSFAVAQEMTVRSLDLIKRKYLWYNDLEAEAMLLSAAEELEREVPWMIVEEKEKVISFHKGKEEAFGSIDISEATMDTVESYLFRMAVY